MRGWVKLDDGMPEHPKIAVLSDSAFRAYVSSIAYAARQLTDGFIPEQVARAYANGSLNELIDQGLWEEHPGGYEVHDYLDYQRSKADITQLREDRKAAGSKGGKASSRAKDKHLLKQKPSKTQAEQEQELVQRFSSPRALAKGPLSSEIQEIYDHWRTSCGKTRSSYDTITTARRLKISTRLSEGFTAADLKTAITNAANDPWEGRVKHNDITVILRSRERVDYFLDLPAASIPPAPVRVNAAAYRIGGAR